MTEPGLILRGLRRSFGPVAVLRGLDLSVGFGKLVAILGASGCGKTTLLRLVAGFDRPDTGSITLGGRVLADDTCFVPPHDRRIGYVPQDGSLFPHLSVADNIGFGLGRDRQAARTAEMLALIGMTGLKARMPHELSGGQQQRVALARAMATAPGLILLDEPFNALDANLRRSLCTEVRHLLRESRATGVLVTHDRDEAFALADEVVVMRAGRVVQSGPPQQIYERPADLDAATLLGPVVCVPARLRAGREQVDTCLGAIPVNNPDAAIGESLLAEGLLAMIRPEQIVPALTQDGVKVTVRSRTFLGPLVWLDLIVADGDGSLKVTACWPVAAAYGIGPETTVAVRGTATLFPRPGAASSDTPG